MKVYFGNANGGVEGGTRPGRIAMFIRVTSGETVGLIEGAKALYQGKEAMIELSDETIRKVRVAFPFLRVYNENEKEI